MTDCGQYGAEATQDGGEADAEMDCDEEAEEGPGQVHRGAP